MADSDAMIYLQAIPASIEPGGTCSIVINGEKGSGYPLPDGTLVNLSATVGILPAHVELVGGRGEVSYRADDVFTGEAFITARCGGASVQPEQLTVTIAGREVAFLFIGAIPMTLPENGGSSQVTVRAVDSEMAPLEGKALWLETSAGTLVYQGDAVTDGNGEVRATLTTERPTRVTAHHKEIESSVDISLEEANWEPYAAFVYSPTNPASGDKVRFNAAESSDSDGRVVAYKWDFGDGGSGRGETVSHTYYVNKTTTFVVTLKVTDDRGGQDVITRSISIEK